MSHHSIITCRITQLQGTKLRCDLTEPAPAIGRRTGDTVYVSLRTRGHSIPPDILDLPGNYVKLTMRPQQYDFTDSKTKDRRKGTRYILENYQLVY